MQGREREKGETESDHVRIRLAKLIQSKTRKQQRLAFGSAKARSLSRPSVDILHVVFFTVAFPALTALRSTLWTERQGSTRNKPAGRPTILIAFPTLDSLLFYHRAKRFPSARAAGRAIGDIPAPLSTCINLILNGHEKYVCVRGDTRRFSARELGRAAMPRVPLSV